MGNFFSYVLVFTVVVKSQNVFDMVELKKDFLI